MCKTALLHTSSVLLLLICNAPALSLDLLSLSLEELSALTVSVTAQKRLQDLDDVPMSISIISNKTIEQFNLNKLQDYNHSTSLYVAESFVGDALFIRGVGSGQNNLGFEQAVGLIHDGFYYGRSRFSRIPLLDTQQIEILKGPQGTLFGKNTTAGAINITSKQPTDDFKASFKLNNQLEGGNGYQLQTMVSGPINQNFKARIALNSDKNDGYLFNQTNNQDDFSHDNLNGRISLLWQPSASLNATLKHQFVELDTDGGNNQFSLCSTATAASVSSNEDCRLNYIRSAIAAKNGVNQEGKDSSFNISNLTVNWQLKNAVLTSLTGFAKYNYQDLQDGERTENEILLTEFNESYHQLSQEIRLVSATHSWFDYILGLDLLKKHQQTDYFTHFNTAANATRLVQTHEDGLSHSIFGNVDFHLNPQWVLSTGLRYTLEEKAARSLQYPSALYTTTEIVAGITPPASIWYSHDVDDDIDEKNLSSSISIQWQPNEHILYYSSLKQSFKAGGFDHQLVSEQVDAAERFSYKAEKATSVEMGRKWQSPRNKTSINMAIFYAEFKDLQLAGFQNPADVNNQVSNAGESVSNGVELDMNWQVSSRFVVKSEITYLDSHFSSYPDAPCYASQTASQGCINERQDLSGKPLQFAAHWKALLCAEYEQPIFSQYSLNSYLSYNYSSSFNLQSDNDPNMKQAGYGTLDMGMALTPWQKQWRLAVLIKNLSDKKASYYGDDVPGGTDSYWRSITAPRSLLLQAKYSF